MAKIVTMGEISVSTAFFDYIYNINETAYAKAILYQWKVV